MNAQLHFGRAREDDASELCRLMVMAFAGSEEYVRKWLASAELVNFRVVRERADAAPIACMVRIEMGQRLGGEPVRMLGIAGVATAPEKRGLGAAKFMMKNVLIEAQREGFALSSLYASTHALYRHVGYEQSGHYAAIRVPIAALQGGAPMGTVVALSERDYGEVEACHEQYARSLHGSLRRGAYVWNRARKWREVVYPGFGIRDDRGALVAYVHINQERKPETGRHDVMISDLAFTSAQAGRALIHFLAGFGTMGDEIEFKGSPAHALLALLPAHHAKILVREHWMLRVLDIHAAFAGLVFDESLRFTINLAIRDELIATNAGRWKLAIDCGRATLVRSDEPAQVTMDIRGLAPMLTGFMGAHALRLAGLIDCDGAQAERLERVLGRGAPAMADFF